MSALVAVIRRDLVVAFATPLWWTLAGCLLALTSWMFLSQVDGYQQVAGRLAGSSDAPGVTDLVAAPFAGTLVGLMTYIAPLVTMRALAEERRQGTLTVLLASGIGEGSLVLAKWFACVLQLALLATLLWLLPLLLAAVTPIDVSRLLVAALGTLAAIAAYAAVGVLVSSYARHPAAAAAATLLVNTLLWMLDSSARAHGETAGLINLLALPTHLQASQMGILSSADLGYFAILITAALALAARRVARIREDA
jgi:ABC-2 type transport system permease protein